MFGIYKVGIEKQISKDANMNERKFTEEDFTEDELFLLKMAFSLTDNVVETLRTDNYDVHLNNVLYNLKNKLGIYELV